MSCLHPYPVPKMHWVWSSDSVNQGRSIKATTHQLTAFLAFSGHFALLPLLFLVNVRELVLWTAEFNKGTVYYTQSTKGHHPSPSHQQFRAQESKQHPCGLATFKQSIATGTHWSAQQGVKDHGLWRTILFIKKNVKTPFKQILS